MSFFASFGEIIHPGKRAGKRAAAEAIAAVIGDDELSSEYIVPSVFNPKVAKDVATAVARAAHKTRVARRLRKTSIYRL
jgi:malate dehydrogenase (oxaloacetate-decarboxylating)